MFDALKNLGGLGNLGELMRKAGEMRTKMTQMQEELARKQVTADAGAGMVTATVNGKLELVKVRIDKTKGAGADDTEMLEDLIVAAVSAAQQKAQAMMQQEMQKLYSDLGLPPGMLPPGLT
jgi:nucleoid-associated protein EbfC